MKEHYCGEVFKNKQTIMKWDHKNCFDKLNVRSNLSHVETHEYRKEDYHLYINERRCLGL